MLYEEYHYAIMGGHHDGVLLSDSLPIVFI